MKQIVMRVLWPQTEEDIACWQCEYADLAEGLPAVVFPLAEAMQRAAGRQQTGDTDIYLLLPAELATMETVQLPARGQRQALQALPFVVEEQLAEDIDDAHIAVGARRPDGSWPVMVVSLRIMDNLFALAGQSAVRLKAIYVDAQCLPWNEGQLSVLIADNRVLLRSANLVTALDLDQAGSMIHLLLGDTAFSRVNIQHDADGEAQGMLAQQIAVEYSALGETQVAMEAVTVPVSGILLKAASVAPALINLLQGRFTVRQPTGVLPWWQAAAAVLLFAWLGQFVLQVSSGWYFSHGASQLEKLAEDQYRKLFPDAKQVSNPRKRLEQRVAAGGSAGDGDSFAWLFGNSVQALNTLPDHQGLSIEQLRYEGQRGQLELELKAKSIDQLDQYKQALGKLGLDGRISSANDGEGGISGRMQISKGG